MNTENTFPVVQLPYKGYIETMCKKMDDGTYRFDYSAPEVDTIEKYNDNKEKGAQIMTWPELEELHTKFKEDQKTQPKEITKEQWWEMLEILPPCKWYSRQGIELFHMSERLTDNLVDWYARAGDQYFTFTDLDCATDEELIKKMEGVL